MKTFPDLAYLYNDFDFTQGRNKEGAGSIMSAETRGEDTRWGRAKGVSNKGTRRQKVKPVSKKTHYTLLSKG